MLVQARTRHHKSDLEWLTPREAEILSEMAQGKSNGAIAKSLDVSERAVEKHSNAIFSKLGLTEEHEPQPPREGGPGVPERSAGRLAPPPMRWHLPVNLRNAVG